MPEKNGFVRTIFWTLILSSFAWSTFVGIGMMKALADESDKRDKCDKEIMEKVETKLEKQQKQQQEILMVLYDLKRDIKYIKGNGN